MQHNSERMSTSEASFVLKSVAAGMRVDGRRNLEPRPLAIAFGADGAAGSVQVRLGGTKVLATATAELIEPFPDRPTEGVLQFFVEFSPMAAPEFEPGRPSEAAVELMKLLERALRKSQAIDVESMCVVAGKHVWSVRVDICVLDHCGNLTDAAVLASLASLKHLRLPSVQVAGNGDGAEVSVLPRDQAEPTPLVFHHMPVAVSLGFFHEGADSAGTPGGSSVDFVVDPTDREESVMVGGLTVVVNQHGELCALHKPGGVPLDVPRFAECVSSAAAIAPKVLSTLEEVLEQHRQKLAEAAEILRRTGRVASAKAVEAGELLDVGDPAEGTAAAQLPPVPPVPPVPPADGPTDEGGGGGGKRKQPRAATSFDSDEEEEAVTISAFENRGGTNHAAGGGAPPANGSNNKKATGGKKGKGKK